MSTDDKYSMTPKQKAAFRAGKVIGAATVPDDVRALLQAVHDALDIPMPSLDDTDERAHYRTLAQRAGVARIALASVLGRGLPDSAGWLNRCIAEMPVTYQVWVPAEQQDPEGQS